jgi:hypothetical protein
VHSKPVPSGFCNFPFEIVVPSGQVTWCHSCWNELGTGGEPRYGSVCLHSVPGSATGGGDTQFQMAHAFLQAMLQGE